VESLIRGIEGTPIWLFALIMFGLFALAVQLGQALGRWHQRGKRSGDAGLLVSATLGLMALLLGFTVSMAVSRYDERRTVMVTEGNAIGTFVYRTDLMPAEQRVKTRDALEDYVAARVTVGQQGINRAELAEARRKQSTAQQLIWEAVVETSAVVPDGSFRILIVGSANEMFDTAAARDIALENRLPHTLVLLLMLFPLASMLLIGYVSDRSARAHSLASFEMILLLTLVLALIADLNRPRAGTIVAPQEVMIGAQDQLRQTQARGAAAARITDNQQIGE
jgi:hypothetical protein